MCTGAVVNDSVLYIGSKRCAVREVVDWAAQHMDICGREGNSSIEFR